VTSRKREGSAAAGSVGLHTDWGWSDIETGRYSDPNTKGWCNTDPALYVANAQALLDGLLARMERRAELDTLFGHEDTDSRKRAAMEVYRSPMGVSIEVRESAADQNRRSR